VPHIVLLGDSVFDNAAYVAGGPDVAAQLRQQAHGRTVTLCAVDGATTTTFPPQVGRIPADATNLVLSLGGNDALGHFDLLERPVSSMAQGLTMLADAADAFERRYRACIHALQPRRLPLTVCTIYNGSFDDRRLARLVRTALAVFNDAILRVAFEHQLRAIDLRIVCNETRDYANPIEPSVHGGEKIVRAILESI